MRWYHLVIIAITISLGFAGCRKSESPSNPDDAKKNDNVAKKGNATLIAKPNPVPAGPGKGATTITWDTGDGSVGQVFVMHNGGEEKLFAGNRAKGTLDAAWIGKGEYEFRLYAGKEKTTILASVKVRRE